MMKKVIITLIAILCLSSLTSCKSKDIATESEAKAYFQKIMEINFPKEAYSYSYSIKIESTELDTKYKTEENVKIKAKGYAKISNDSQNDQQIINLLLNGKYTSKSNTGKKITSKENLVVLDYNFKQERENMEMYFSQNKKMREQYSKQTIKSNIKSKTNQESTLFNDDNFELMFDLEKVLKDMFESVLENGLVYITDTGCNIIIDATRKGEPNKLACDLKISGTEIKKIKITCISSGNKAELVIDLTKKGTIDKPKDYEKYLSE